MVLVIPVDMMAPVLYHMMVGRGTPEALQENITD